MSNGDSNSNNYEQSSKRSTMKTSSLLNMVSSTNSNIDSSVVNDNRIKFIDMLVCGSCQQDFQLSDILKFIEHKAKCGNKENKQRIPYHFPQRNRRRRMDYNDDDDDDGGEDNDDEDDQNSRHSGNSSESDHEHNIHHDQSDHQRASQKRKKSSKVLVDANTNTFKTNSKYYFRIK